MTQTPGTERAAISEPGVAGPNAVRAAKIARWTAVLSAPQSVLVAVGVIDGDLIPGLDVGDGPLAGQQPCSHE